MKKQSQADAKWLRIQLRRNAYAHRNGGQRQRRMNSRTTYQCIAGMARDSRNACYTMVESPMPCPFCQHPITESLELSDGRVTYCSQCGYRGLTLATNQP